MSAEVVSGGRPSFLADAWSFGCLLHFLLTARPPIVGDDEESIKQRVVQFNVEARRRGEFRRAALASGSEG